MQAFLGLGSNLGDRLATLQRAIDLLGAQPGIDVVRTSRVWETDPVGGPDQPDFLNIVAEVQTELEPHALLDAVNRIEASLGRTRDVRWGPRTIDIDILLIDQLTIDDDRLTVPHPRMHQRAFVLLPLIDLIPDPVLPDDTHLLDVRLPDQPARPLAPPLLVPVMTNARTCLRCDWHGETRRLDVPELLRPPLRARADPRRKGREPVRGHPEERSREAASTASVAPSAAPPRPSSPAPPTDEAAEPTSTRSRSLVAVVLAVVVLAVAVGWWLNAHTAPTPARAPAGRTGGGPDRHARLRRAGRRGSLTPLALGPRDRAGGARSPGPPSDRAGRRARRHGRVDRGHVGVARRPARGLGPAVLGPDDRATPILRGDDVGWGRRAGPPSLVRRDRSEPGAAGRSPSCGLGSSPLCVSASSRPVALRRSALHRAGRRAHVLHPGSRRTLGMFFAGIGRIHRGAARVRDDGRLGVSDIIVVPEGALATARPLPDAPGAGARRPVGCRALLQSARIGRCRMATVTTGSRSRGSSRGRPTARRSSSAGRAFAAASICSTPCRATASTVRRTSVRCRGSRTARSR